MTQRSVTYLKGRFETNDIPTQSDYQDVFDSFLSLESSAEQSINGRLNCPAVSATTVSAENVHINGFLRNSYMERSPSGTTQASACVVSADMAYVTCTVAGERSLVLPEHHQGRRQYIVSDTASVTAISLFPAAGMNFLGTAANGPLLLSVGQSIQILHVAASAYSYQRF
jgi:hypothetical protein